MRSERAAIQLCERPVAHVHVHRLLTPTLLIATRSGKSELEWEEFVDGAISLGAAVTLIAELATAEGEADFRAIFDTLQPDEDGRVVLADLVGALRAHPDVLARCTGLEAEATPRFQAFFRLGRVDEWIRKIFRRLALHDDAVLTWEDFMASVRANDTT